MSESENPVHHDDETQAALLEAELFLKYDAPRRAVERLRAGVERRPHSVVLRERLREVALAVKLTDEAARQCLALANIYITHDDFERAQQRLLEAKEVDPRISVTTGLEAIRRARQDSRAQRGQRETRVSLEPPLPAPPATTPVPTPLLAGDLAAVSLFDAVQVIENSRLTGALVVIAASADLSSSSETANALRRVFFNSGRIVGAEAASLTGAAAFRRIVEITEGTFRFERAGASFPVTIDSSGNTNLLLDALRQIDEENAK